MCFSVQNENIIKKVRTIGCKDGRMSDPNSNPSPKRLDSGQNIPGSRIYKTSV